MRHLSYLIDRFPEAPYYLLSITYLLFQPPADSIYLFSGALIFVVLSFGLGVALKLALKTERPNYYCSLPAVEYDVPSLHTLVSLGGAAYVYTVNPHYGFVLFPIALAYMYARLESGFHSKKAVFVGAVLGVSLGYLFSIVNLFLFLPVAARTMLAVLFFALPPFTVAFRLKHVKIGSLDDLPVHQKV
ncbi:MAG: hypothetical protein GF334_09970 [Candidatus Altiarchaeales archaeon]|nr:hypothetical protein [Candidatus Altiarchaeales archaeon]